MRHDQTGRDPGPAIEDLITARSDVLSGRRVFRGTRVPIEVLFENLADGLSLDEILAAYETLDREDVVRVLQLASRALVESGSDRSGAA